MLEWASLRNRPDVREANGPSSSGGASEPKPAKKTGISLALRRRLRRAAGRHIGVLRALDEAGIEVSMIAGTSIGALVGGCYLAGKLDELEEFARSLTKRRIFGLLDLNLGGSGLFGGMKLDARMQRAHEPALRFEDLAKPFVCVAAEIRTGHEIWLSERLADHRHARLLRAARRVRAGDLQRPRAGRRRAGQSGAGLGLPRLRAAARGCGQPALRSLRPRRGDQAQRRRTGRREGCAKAGRVDTERQSRETRLGITGVMVEAFNIIQDRISRARLAGDPPDMSLQPKLSHIGLSEFHRADEAIRIGYEATMAQIGELARLQTVLA